MKWYPCCDVHGESDTCWSCGSADYLIVRDTWATGGMHVYTQSRTKWQIHSRVIHVDPVDDLI